VKIKKDKPLPKTAKALRLRIAHDNSRIDRIQRDSSKARVRLRGVCRHGRVAEKPPVASTSTSKYQHARRICEGCGIEEDGPGRGSSYSVLKRPPGCARAVSADEFEAIRQRCACGIFASDTSPRKPPPPRDHRPAETSWPSDLPAIFNLLRPQQTDDSTPAAPAPKAKHSQKRSKAKRS
jgi:hypothetical protein